MTTSDFIEILKKFTPSFIVRNDNLEDLYSALSKTLLSAHNGLVDLIDAIWVEKGLRFNADENQILYNPSTAPDSVIQALVATQYLINKARGTEAGVLSDWKNLTGDPAATAVFYGYDQCGIIVDVTYLGIDIQAVVDLIKLVVLTYTTIVEAVFDTGLFDDIYFDQNSVVFVENLTKIVRNKIVPIDIQIIYG